MPPEDPKLIHSNDPKRKTDKALLATAYFYHDALLMAGYATLLGKAEDARHFTELAEKLKAAFNEKFFRADTGQYDNGSQTSCVLPLAFGLVPDGERERVFNHLVKKITDETQGHIGTGLIGGQWLMRVLTAGGRADLAYTIADAEDLSELGLHGGERRDDHLGAVERRHRRPGDELRQPRHARGRSGHLAL